MGYKDWYTFNQSPNGFVCVATDEDQEFVKQYEITMRSDDPTKIGICSCFAGHTWCRHKKMLVVFQQKALIGTRTYYNFDRGKWKHAPQMEA